MAWDFFYKLSCTIKSIIKKTNILRNDVFHGYIDGKVLKKERLKYIRQKPSTTEIEHTSNQTQCKNKRINFFLKHLQIKLIDY